MRLELGRNCQDRLTCEYNPVWSFRSDPYLKFPEIVRVKIENLVIQRPLENG